MSDKKSDDIIFLLQLSLRLLLLVFCTLLLLNMAREHANKTKNIVTEVYPLESIRADENVDGSFFLGTGDIDSKHYYVGYCVLEDGGKALIKIPANDTIIYETVTSHEHARLEIDRNGYDSIVGYRLYVPEGTIIQAYTLALDV